jgi:hypothetical protein
MNKCHSRVRASSEKRTYNMQCTIFTDTSLNFILLQTRFRPKRGEQSTKCFREKYIRCRYRRRRLVCIERYIGTFLYFFLFCFCFTILFLSSSFGTERSRVLCRSERSRVGKHRAPSTAQRRGKYFLACVDARVL